MSSEKYVRIILAENLRFLEEGSSAPSKWLIFRNHLPFKQRDTFEGNIPGVG